MDWARDLADRKKQELEGKRIQQEKDLSDRKMLDAHANPMWDELRQEIGKAVEEFNQAMGSAYITSHKAASGPDRVVLEMDGATHTILFMSQIWTVIGPGGYSYKLTVVAGNGVVWKNQNGNTFGSEMIARNEVTATVNKKNH